MADWLDFTAKLDGRRLHRHAVLTFSGTWAPAGWGYPTDVVNGLNEFVDPRLCYEVPVQAPWSFGPVGGPPDSPSYQESIGIAIAFAADWIRAHPGETFALIGYSQGAEAASRVLLGLQDGSIPGIDRFIGGITFGNPSRGAGFHAPGIADPGGRGISPVRMTSLPTIDGRTVWADYVHSKANGDPGLDMYASVPDSTIGDDMTAVYKTATELQLHSFEGFTTFMVNLWNDAAKALTAPMDAIQAALKGAEFVLAPGGPTAPHITYEGAAGYSNMLAPAVGFLADLATTANARLAT